MKERLEEITRRLITLSLVRGGNEKFLALAAIALLDREAQEIEREYLGYGE